VGAVAVRPGLWAVAARQAVRTARPGWWRRPPFVPRPEPAYARFRLETQDGRTQDGRTQDGRTAPRARDLVIYLRWCRAQEAVVRAGRRRTRR